MFSVSLNKTFPSFLPLVYSWFSGQCLWWCDKIIHVIYKYDNVLAFTGLQLSKTEFEINGGSESLTVTGGSANFIDGKTKCVITGKHLRLILSH